LTGIPPVPKRARRWCEESPWQIQVPKVTTVAFPPLAVLLKHGAVMNGIGVTDRNEPLLDWPLDLRDWKPDVYSLFKRTRKWRQECHLYPVSDGVDVTTKITARFHT
jgi:hypothetical protein